MRALAHFSRPIPFTPARVRRVLLALVVPMMPVASGCGASDDGTVVISGDVEGLDTIGFRGDSLIAQAGRLALGVDSPVVLRGEDSVSVGVPVPDSVDPNARMARTAAASGMRAPGDNPMSRRAMARGDSMAKAAAARLVGRGDAETRARGDTVRGVVTVVGTPPAVQAKLRTSSGALVSLSGMASSGLPRLAGAELVVRGVKVSPRDVVVTDYLVRGMNGMPAYDGTLEGSGGGWSLVLTDGSGRKRLDAVPPSLQSAAGARVWVAMREGSSAPAAFGLVGRR